MDKKFIVYSKRKTLDLQERLLPSPSDSSSTCQTNPSDSTSSNATLKEKHRKKSQQHVNTKSKNLWKNFSNIFNKNNESTCVESASIKMLKDKTSKGITSLFKNPKLPKDSAKIDISSIGLEATFSDTNIDPNDDKDIAMAVRLPSGTTTENVAVTIELEANKKGDEPTMVNDSNETMVMKCCEETDSQTVFTGILRLSSNTDISKLANMPLYLIDSSEKLMLNPGTELCCKRRIRPSEDMLLSDDSAPLMVNDVKIKLKLNKLNDNKPKKNKKKRNPEKVVLDQSSNEMIKKDLEETKLELSKILDKLTEAAFKKYEEKITTNSIKELLNECVDAASKKSEKSALKAEIENYLDELLTNRIFKRYSELSTASKEKDTNKKVNITEGEVNYIKNLPLEKRLSMNKNIQELITNYGLPKNDSNNSQDNRSSTKEVETFAEKIKSICERLNVPLKEDELKQAIKEFYNSAIAKKFMRDSYTQYSVTNFIKNEEVPTQSSLFLTSYNDTFVYNSPSTTTSSQMFLTPFSSLPIGFSPTIESSKSSDTVLPKSTSSLTTDLSNTIVSNQSEDPSRYKVPSNTPSSYTKLNISDQRKIKGVKNDIDLAINNRGVEKITLTYKKPEKSRVPISIKPNNSYKTEALQTEEFPLVSSSSIVESTLIGPMKKKFGDFSSPEDELVTTELEYRTKQTGTENIKKDKTLELLECARCKLLIYLKNQEKPKKRPEQDLNDVCGLYTSDVDCDEKFANNVTEIRNIRVCLNNPFNPYQKKEDCKERGEHYEKRRRVINHQSASFKKNSNYYTSGDNLDQEVDSEFSNNAVFQVYPLIFNNKAFSMDSVEVESRQELLNNDCFPSKDSLESKLSENSVSYKLIKEFDSLQNMYEDMCASMRIILDIPETPTVSSDKLKKTAGKIETIGDDLMNTFNELKACLSTINHILSDSSVSVEIKSVYPKDGDLEKLSSNISISSENHEDRHQTYFTMENEIERTIQELLKESEYIREAVILNGGKEEAEPPFSFEYIQKLDDPYSVCKMIFEEIINCSVPEELQKETKDKLEGPHADIKYILNVLLEEVEKNNFFLDKSKTSTADTAERHKGNSLFNKKSKLSRANLQSGDINSSNNSLFDRKNNNQIVYFQNSTSLNSKIPKTSFSFGETPSVDLEITSPNYKTPARQRDGLTVNDNSSPRSLETSRLFNELIHLQSDFKHPKGCDRELKTEMSEDNLCLKEEHSTHNLVRDLQEQATASRVLENSVPNEDISNQLQEISSYKPTNTFQILSDKNSIMSCQDENEDVNNEDNSNSEGNDDQNPQPSKPSGVKKSQKCLQVCLNKETQNPLPSTSTKRTNTRSTDEEIYLRDTDLVHTTTVTDSGTDSEQAVGNVPFLTSQAFSQVYNSDVREIQKSPKGVQLTDSLNRDIPKHRPSASTSTKDTRTTDDEALLQTLDLNQQTAESSEPEYFISEKVSGFSRKSIKSFNQARLNRQLYEASSSEEETVSNASKRPRSKKKKDNFPIVEIKPGVSFVSDSDSNQFPNMRQATINSDQGLITGNSHIVLKSAEAVQDMQDILKNRTQEPVDKITTITEDAPEKVMNRVTNASELTLGNASEAVDSEYEGDHETVQMKIPNPKHRFKSVQELNTPEEIAKIEENVKENEQLERMARIILIASSSSQLEYDVSSSSSNDYSRSNYSVKAPSTASGEIKVVDMETPLSTPLHQP